jgi:hypothetical protein
MIEPADRDYPAPSVSISSKPEGTAVRFEELFVDIVSTNF